MVATIVFYCVLISLIGCIFALLVVLPRYKAASNKARKFEAKFAVLDKLSNNEIAFLFRIGPLSIADLFSFEYRIVDCYLKAINDFGLATISREIYIIKEELDDSDEKKKFLLYCLTEALRRTPVDILVSKVMDSMSVYAYNIDSFGACEKDLYGLDFMIEFIRAEKNNFNQLFTEVFKAKVTASLTERKPGDVKNIIAGEEAKFLLAIA